MTTLYYVDPNYTGGTRTGAAAHPWQDLDDTHTNTPWTEINNSLAAGPVTVYYSAVLSTGSADSRTPTAIGASGGGIAFHRTNTSSNLLTLDGYSFYNTTTGTTDGAWVAYTGWTSYLSKMHRQVSRGVDVLSSLTAEVYTNNHITIQGFRLMSEHGHHSVLECMNYVTLKDCECYCGTGTGYSTGRIAVRDDTPGGVGTGCHVIIDKVDDEGHCLAWHIATADVGSGWLVTPPDFNIPQFVGGNQDCILIGYGNSSGGLVTVWINGG